MPVIGDLSMDPLRNRYLKKDFKDEILRLILFEEILFSFKLASQERIKGVDMD
jgi:hypothetical protein